MAQNNMMYPAGGIQPAQETQDRPWDGNVSISIQESQLTAHTFLAVKTHANTEKTFEQMNDDAFAAGLRLEQPLNFSYCLSPGQLC